MLISKMLAVIENLFSVLEDKTKLSILLIVLNWILNLKKNFADIYPGQKIWVKYADL